MKLIDILVQELPKRGGWPEGAAFVAQEEGGELWSFTSKPQKDCDDEWMDESHHGYHTKVGKLREASDHDVSTITREQYEAALAAKNDGWIDWGGGECPVQVGTLVDVKWRDGRMDDGIPAGVRHSLSGKKRHALSWDNVGIRYDIIAYRLHKPQEVTEADDEADLNECIGQDVATAWNGEGKPAIGTKCEHHSGGQWEVVTIAGIYENLVTGFTDYWMVKEDGCSYTVGNPYRFRPIRSEADKKREEAIMSIAKAGGAAPFKYGEKFNDGSLIGAAWYELYDAIAAGKIPGVKLEG